MFKYEDELYLKTQRLTAYLNLKHLISMESIKASNYETATGHELDRIAGNIGIPFRDDMDSSIKETDAQIRNRIREALT